MMVFWTRENFYCYILMRAIKTKNPTYQWNYEFIFEGMTGSDECKNEFRFQKSDIPHLCASLHLDDVGSPVVDCQSKLHVYFRKC